MADQSNSDARDEWRDMWALPLPLVECWRCADAELGPWIPVEGGLYVCEQCWEQPVVRNGERLLKYLR